MTSETVARGLEGVNVAAAFQMGARVRVIAVGASRAAKAEGVAVDIHAARFEHDGTGIAA